MTALDFFSWPGMNQAFLVSLFASLAMAAGVVLYGARRPVGKRLTWGEAMLGSAYIFFMLFLTYGIMPHQFITHADADLGWTKDKIIFGPGDILKPESQGGWLPLTLQYEAVRDTVVVLLHAVFSSFTSASRSGGRSEATLSRPLCPHRPTAAPSLKRPDRWRRRMQTLH